MNARLTGAALALAWSGIILAGCTERPTEPLATGNPAADVVIQNGAVLPFAKAGEDVSTYPNEAVTLDGTASYDPLDRDIVSYSWVVDWGPDGGDLSNSESATASFTPYMPGDYYLTLTVCVQGDVEQACGTDQVMVSVGNREPQAWIDAEPTTVTVGKTVQFDGSGSSDPDQQDLSYSWDFGDGQTSYLMSPTHAFAATGEYWVSLEVWDGWLSGKTEILITVEEEPDPRDGIVSLISGIRSLVTNGELSADRGDGLLSKLNAALTSLDNGLTTDARKQLSAFEKQVAASVKARKLDAEIGQALIQASTSLRTQIGSA